MKKHKNKVKISYRDKLTKDARDRYLENFSSIHNIDLYELTAVSWSATDPALLPKSSYLNIVNCLVYGINA